MIRDETLAVYMREYFHGRHTIGPSMAKPCQLKAEGTERLIIRAGREGIDRVRLFAVTHELSTIFATH